MQVFLDATDTFFFRDGRPFTRGEQTEGYSIDMPHPSTVMGALRTAYIAANGGLQRFEAGHMRQVIGTKETLDGASVRIKGVFIGNAPNNGVFFPVPRDLVAQKKSTSPQLYALSLQEEPDFASNAALPGLLTWDHPELVVEPTSGLLGRAMLRRYLLGETNELVAETESPLLNEPKVGIARSHFTHTAEEGMLYRLNMKRFRHPGYGFVVDVEGLENFPSSGLLKLGGENKSFRYHTIALPPDPLDAADRARIVASIAANRLCKLYLATTAMFDQGWLPQWVGEDFRGNVPTTHGRPVHLQVIAAAVGNHLTVGGWAVANGQRGPKPAYRAVPAGSVYYFRLLEDTHPQDVMDHFHDHNRSDRQQQEGFGLSYVGAVPHD